MSKGEEQKNRAKKFCLLFWGEQSCDNGVLCARWGTEWWRVRWLGE